LRIYSSFSGNTFLAYFSVLLIKREKMEAGIIIIKGNYQFGKDNNGSS
jgi:hypothetical protein